MLTKRHVFSESMASRYHVLSKKLYRFINIPDVQASTEQSDTFGAHDTVGKGFYFSEQTTFLLACLVAFSLQYKNYAISNNAVATFVVKISLCF